MTPSKPTPGKDAWDMPQEDLHEGMPPLLLPKGRQLGSEIVQKIRDIMFGQFKPGQRQLPQRIAKTPVEEVHIHLPEPVQEGPIPFEVSVDQTHIGVTADIDGDLEVTYVMPNHDTQDMMKVSLKAGESHDFTNLPIHRPLRATVKMSANGKVYEHKLEIPAPTDTSDTVDFNHPPAQPFDATSI